MVLNTCRQQILKSGENSICTANANLAARLQSLAEDNNRQERCEYGNQVRKDAGLHGPDANHTIGEQQHCEQCRKRAEVENAEHVGSNTYWFPTTLPGVSEMIEELGAGYRQFILFGEVYGSKVQDLHYGCRGRFGFRAFDILADGKYMDADAFFAGMIIETAGTGR